MKRTQQEVVRIGMVWGAYVETVIEAGSLPDHRDHGGLR
jgi:hypothetical protein